jgi:hypothetical protein
VRYCTGLHSQEFKRLQKAGVSHTSVQRSNQRSNERSDTTTTTQYAASSSSVATNQQWAWSSGQRSDQRSETAAAADVQHDEAAAGDGTTLQGRRHIEALIDSMGRDDSNSGNSKLHCLELHNAFIRYSSCRYLSFV